MKLEFKYCINLTTLWYALKFHLFWNVAGNYHRSGMTRQDDCSHIYYTHVTRLSTMKNDIYRQRQQQRDWFMFQLFSWAFYHHCDSAQLFHSQVSHIRLPRKASKQEQNSTANKQQCPTLYTYWNFNRNKCCIYIFILVMPNFVQKL